MPNALASALETTRQTFSEGRREAEVCTFIFEQLENLKDGFECISLGEVASHFKWHNNKDAAKSIQIALDYLSYGTIPVLERKFVLWPEDEEDILETEEVIFSDADIRDALEHGKLINPNTGLEVQNFLDKIQVIYCTTKYIKDIANQSKGSS